MRVAGPPVWGLHTGRMQAAKFLSFSVGLVLAAAAVATVLGSLQPLLRPGRLAVAAILAVLGLASLLAPARWGIGGWRVPRQWEAWGPSRYLFVFGFALGLGFLTAVPSLILVGFQLWVWSLPAWGALMVGEASFVLGRLLVPVLTAYQARGGDVVTTTDRLVARVAALGHLEALIAFGLAAVLTVQFFWH